MSNKVAPSNWPPTFPRFLRNSSMTPAFQSLIVIDGRYIVTRRDLLTSNIKKLATWSCRDNLPKPCVKIGKSLSQSSPRNHPKLSQVIQASNQECSRPLKQLKQSNMVWRESDGSSNSSNTVP